MSQLLRAAEQALHKAEHFRDRAQRVARDRRGVRQTTCDQFAPTGFVQERPERRRPRVRAELLVGELDFDRLAPAFELDLLGHRLVNRALALRLIRFHSPSISSHSVAPFQLHRYG